MFKFLFFLVLSIPALVGPARSADTDRRDAPAYEVRFEILRGDDPIGEHRVEVASEDGALVARTFIDMKVKFGPIALFKYKHRATEIWRDNVLQALESATNNNGEKMWARAERVGGALVVSGSGFEGAAPAGAVPSSYWNKTVIGARHVLNTQSGEIHPVTVEMLDDDSLAPHGGAGEAYKMSGTVDLYLWYRDGHWVGSNFVIDGEELTYRLVESIGEPTGEWGDEQGVEWAGEPTGEERRYAAN